MTIKKWIVLVLCLNFSIVGLRAQCAAGGLGGGGGNLINELGVVVGPVVFENDYLSSSKIDFDNLGYGIGIVHYLNFSGMRDNYFNQHFKVRNEVAYQVTEFEHHGPKVDKTKNGKKLAAMHGKTKVLEFGTNLEWYPFGVGHSAYSGGKLVPYLSLGIHFVHFSPEAESDLGGRLGYDAAVTPDKYLASPGTESYIQTNDGNTYSVSGAIGLRYQIGRRSDLQLDLRAVYYGADDVDGIRLENSQYNDAIAWVTLGYIYYLGL